MNSLLTRVNHGVLQIQAYSVRNIEEIVSVVHCICMVYCFIADVKVSMDDPPHETLTFKKPYKN